MKTHVCAVPGCQARIKPVLLMCRTHWRRGPNPIKRAVFKHYREGQNSQTATPEYMEAYYAAVDSVKTKKENS